MVLLSFTYGVLYGTGNVQALYSIDHSWLMISPDLPIDYADWRRVGWQRICIGKGE